jgi:hypothetical protein
MDRKHLKTNLRKLLSRTRWEESGQERGLNCELWPCTRRLKTQTKIHSLYRSTHPYKHPKCTRNLCTDSESTARVGGGDLFSDESNAVTERFLYFRDVSPGQQPHPQTAHEPLHLSSLSYSNAKSGEIF